MFFVVKSFWFAHIWRFGIFNNFEGKLNFTTTLVPYVTNASWVQDKIIEMKKTLELDNVPEINKSCEKCMYINTGKDFI